MKYHPKKNDNGQPVRLSNPHEPTPLDTWFDSSALAIVVPEGPMPESVGDIPVSHWRTASDNIHVWNDMAKDVDFSEPAFSPPAHLKRSAGVVVIEQDERVWVVAPSNAFGGYTATFPKGRVEEGMSLRSTALREAYEESGLLVRLQGFLIDVPRSTTYTRYYLARRIGGDPAQMGWESQAVMLVPKARLNDILTNSNDKPILNALFNHL